MPCSVLDAALLNPVGWVPVELDFLGAARPSITEACSLVRVINLSNVEIFISHDGINPHDYVGPVVGSLTLPAQTGASPSNWVALFAKNSMIYVNGAAGIGNIVVAGYYQEG